MTYEPLHHKYRPQTFAELVGQEAIASTLTNALRQQRIAPAYLFTGARGTGKTSSARIFAKSLNCLTSEVPTEKPCGRCDACRMITLGNALDVIEIDAASNTGVDNIRELIERAQFAPVQCRYKVYVIDECHMLSSAAFNALLKTLEEPPLHVVFVLATTDPQRVLPTIISRCQRFDFRRIPLEAIAQHLGTISQKETISIAADALQLIAQISQGGLRDAESLLDQLSLIEGEISTEKVWDLVGAVPERDLLDLVKAIASDQPAAVLDRTRHLMDRGREPLVVLQNLTSFYRDLLIAKTAPARGDLAAITPPTWAEMCQFAETLAISVIQQGQKCLQENEVRVRNTTQPRLWLEVTLMGLMPSAISAQSISSGISAPPLPVLTQTASNSVRVQPAATATPVAVIPMVVPPVKEEARSAMPPSPTLSSEPDRSVAAAETDPINEDDAVAASPTAEAATDLGRVWQEILTLVQPFSTQTMLRQQCRLIAFNGTEARIGTTSQPLFKMAKDRLPNIEVAFTKLCNQPVRVSLEVVAVDASTPVVTISPETPVRSPAPPRPPHATPAPPAAPPSNNEAPPEPPSHPIPSQKPSGFSTPSQAIGSQPIHPPQSSPMEAPQSSPMEANNASPSQPLWSREDDVLRAAKSFAQMFNGQLVTLDDDFSESEGEEPDNPLETPLSSELSALTATSTVAVNAVSEPEDDSDDDDDDIPF